MPTLLFDDNFNRVERTILSKTFKINCRDLGITHHDATIETRKVPLGHPKRWNGGEEYCLGGITQVAPDRFVMGLNGDSFRLKRGIWCLGHELVHFHQCIRGDMDEVNRGQRDGGTIWKGQFIPDFIAMNPVNYLSLPWEVEAHAKQQALFDNAIASLNPMERVIANDTDWSWGESIAA